MLIIRFILSKLALSFYYWANDINEKGIFNRTNNPKDSYMYAVGGVELAFAKFYKDVADDLVQRVRDSA